MRANFRTCKLSLQPPLCGSTTIALSFLELAEDDCFGARACPQSLQRGYNAQFLAKVTLLLNSVHPPKVKVCATVRHALGWKKNRGMGVVVVREVERNGKAETTETGFLTAVPQALHTRLYIQTYALRLKKKKKS